MAGCAPFNPVGSYVQDVVKFIDCRSLSIAEEGYRALGADSQFGMAITGLLIMVVALNAFDSSRRIVRKNLSVTEAQQQGSYPVCALVDGAGCRRGGLCRRGRIAGGDPRFFT